MSLHKSIGLPAHEIDAIDNWIAWLHSGKSVVPVDYHREVDRFEVRVPPLAYWGEAVDAQAYRPLLATCRDEALVVAALTIGGRKNRAREFGFSKAQCEGFVRKFAREAGGVDLASMKLAGAKIPAVVPYVVSGEYRKAVKAPKVGSREWMALQVAT
jgi:hypothetical protein